MLDGALMYCLFFPNVCAKKLKIIPLRILIDMLC